MGVPRATQWKCPLATKENENIPKIIHGGLLKELSLKYSVVISTSDPAPEFAVKICFLERAYCTHDKRRNEARFLHRYIRELICHSTAIRLFVLMSSDIGYQYVLYINKVGFNNMLKYSYSHNKYVQL